jgi:hypothetical protein
MKSPFGVEVFRPDDPRLKANDSAACTAENAGPRFLGMAGIYGVGDGASTQFSVDKWRIPENVMKID